MNLRAMPTGDLIFVLEQMLIAARKVWESLPILKVFLPMADAVLHDLKTAAAPGGKSSSSDPEVGRSLDRRAEHSIRALFYAIKVAQSLAFARDEADRGREFEQAGDDLFGSGLAFLGAAVPAQVGETSRLGTLAAAPPIASLFDGLVFGDVTWPQLLALVAERNEALRGHAAPLVPPADPTPPAQTLTQARNAAVSFLNDILPIIDRVLPASDPLNAEPRRLLLGDLSARALVAARKAKAASSASTPAVPPADAPDTSATPAPATSPVDAPAPADAEPVA